MTPAPHPLRCEHEKICYKKPSYYAICGVKNCPDDTRCAEHSGAVSAEKLFVKEEIKYLEKLIEYDIHHNLVFNDVVLVDKDKIEIKVKLRDLKRNWKCD